MGFRMQTTLNIDDTAMAELKREAARQSRTMPELVEIALRLLLTSQWKRERIPRATSNHEFFSHSHLTQGSRTCRGNFAEHLHK